jgi:hypothetical protein
MAKATQNIVPSVTFEYNDRGYGLLILDAPGDRHEYLSRTGYIDGRGMLMCALPVGIYGLLDVPVKTTEIGMWIDDEKFGWKCRLWRSIAGTKWISTSYLIHPDGNKPGTMGCIGLINTNARPLFKALTKILTDTRLIKVTVTATGAAK